MLKIFDHPIARQKLTKLRNKSCSRVDFQTNLSQIATMMILKFLEDYQTTKIQVKTLTNSLASGEKLKKQIILVPILRAGLGMVKDVQNFIPEVKIGHIGIYRDEITFKPHKYFYKMPNVDKDSIVLLLDPMLATGNSATKALDLLKANKFTNINLVCIIGVQEGIDQVQKQHRKVPILLLKKDKKLNAKKFIIPGLGDAGDRIFGTN